MMDSPLISSSGGILAAAVSIGSDSGMPSIQSGVLNREISIAYSPARQCSLELRRTFAIGAPQLLSRMRRHTSKVSSATSSHRRRYCDATTESSHCRCNVSEILSDSRDTSPGGNKIPQFELTI